MPRAATLAFGTQWLLAPELEGRGGGIGAVTSSSAVIHGRVITFLIIRK
jgi:hypothetical protein